MHIGPRYVGLLVAGSPRPLSLNLAQEPFKLILSLGYISR
jgi:hypothetical protein